MALPKLYDRIVFHNDTEPALNEDNLNAMSKGLDDVDDRLIGLAGTIMEDVPQILEDMEILGPAVQQIASNVQRAETAADTAEDAAESATASEQAATTAASAAEGVLDQVEDIKDDIADLIGAPIFSVDFTTGNLIYSLDGTYTFQINTTTGNLEWEVEA